MLLTIIFSTIGFILITHSLIYSNKYFKHDLILKVIPFLSGAYIALSQLKNAQIYSPIAMGIIGLYLLCFSLLINTKDIYSKILSNILPFIFGLFLIVNSLKEMSLL